MAMMQGGSGASHDLPPFTVVRRINHLCELNIVGLRRAGISAADRLELKRLYRFLCSSGKNLRAALVQAESEFTGASAQTLLRFVAESKRGVCTPSVDFAAGESE